MPLATVIGKLDLPSRGRDFLSLAPPHIYVCVGMWTCAQVYVGMCVQVNVHMCAHAGGGQREMLGAVQDD